MDEGEVLEVLDAVLSSAIGAVDPMEGLARGVRLLACGASIHPEPWRRARSILTRCRAAEDPIGEMERIRDAMRRRVEAVASGG